jgi:sugar lactone lactonase YvrE
MVQCRIDRPNRKSAQFIDFTIYSRFVYTQRGQEAEQPNDVVLGPDGAVYFTDPTYDSVKGEKQAPACTPFPPDIARL